MNNRQRDVLFMVILFLVTAVSAYWVMDVLMSSPDSAPTTYQTDYDPYPSDYFPEDANDALPVDQPPLSPGIIAARQELADIPFEPGSIADKLYNLLTSSKQNYNRELYTFLHKFSPESSQLSPELKAELDQLASVLLAYPHIAVSIDCHTDNADNRNTMRQTSIRQAKAIADHLISLGIQANQITTTGYGSDVPLTANTSENGRNQNRRIEMTILAR